MADTTKPGLTGLTLPSTIDVTGGVQAFTYSASATDDSSGVGLIILNFDKQFAETVSTGSYGYSGVTSLSSNFAYPLSFSGSAQLAIDPATPAGVYTLSSVAVYDGYSNLATYSTADLVALGVSTSVTVKSNTPADTSKPTLVSLTLPQTLTPDYTTQPYQPYGTFLTDYRATATASATDIGTGIYTITVNLDKSWTTSGGASRNQLSFALSPHAGLSTLTDTEILPVNYAPGPYNITSVVLKDYAGNATTYSVADLTAIGIKTSFSFTTAPPADQTVPTLTSLGFSTVPDPVHGGRILTFSAGATDAGSSVDSVSVKFNQSWQGTIDPTYDGYSSSQNSVFTYNSNDSFADGSSSRQFYMSSPAAGSYTLNSVTVTDKTGNQSVYSAAQLVTMGLQTRFDVSATAAPDTTGPVLTALTLPSPATDTQPNSNSFSTTFPNTGAAIAGFSDVGSGVKSVVVNFDKPWYSSTDLSNGTQQLVFSGSSTGLSTTTTQWLGVNSSGGPFNITSAVVTDNAGNATTYSNADLARMGIQTSFSFDSTTPYESAKPVLTSLAFAPTVDLTNGGKAITFTADATDVGLGVAAVSVTFDHSWQGETGTTNDGYVTSQSSFFAFDTTDSFSDGLSSRQFYIDPTSPTGTYTINTVTVLDKDGNNSTYTAAKLAALNLQTSFVVTNGPPAAAVTAPTSVTEGADPSFALSVTLKNVKTADGTITMSLSPTGTATGADVTVPTSPQAYHITQTTAGDYVITLAPITITDDLTVEPTRTIDISVYAPGETFANGTDTTIVHVPLYDGDQNGTDGNDVLTGTAGRDYLSGGAGDDVLRGGPGADVMVGGAGNDVYDVDTFDLSTLTGDQVIEKPGEGIDTVYAHVNYQLADNVEQLILLDSATTGIGNALDNTIRGSDLGDHLYGGAGNDTLIGGAGADSLDGGAGADTMSGGAGNDTYVVDDAGDVVSEKPNEGTDLVLASISYALPDNVEKLTLTGTANINATGNALDNVLTGNGGNNILSGGDGNDTFYTGGGRDIVDGGAGTDTLVLTGTRASYAVFTIAGQTYLIGAGEGVRATNIEQVRFADQTASWNSVVSTALPFDTTRYLASYPDLAAAFSTNPSAAAAHFASNGFFEGRSATTFDAREYLVSNPDLIRAFGDNPAAAQDHYTHFGIAEGRPTASFDALEYLASNSDLIRAFGDNLTAARDHYITNGINEGRSFASFDALKYIDSYPDLIRTYGTDVIGATENYINSGYAAGRAPTFNALAYAAASPDLAKAFGTNVQAAELHYITNGYAEGRPTSGFDAVAYALTYQDLGNAGLTIAQDFTHWLTSGAKEGRIGDALYGREQTNHAASLGTTTHDTLDTTTDHDWFQVTLTANQTINFSLAAQTFDPLLQIFNDHGVLQAQAQGPTTGSTAALSFAATQTGTYYIATSATDAHTGDYDLSLKYPSIPLQARDVGAPDPISPSSDSPQVQVIGASTSHIHVDDLDMTLHTHTF